MTAISQRVVLSRDIRKELDSSLPGFTFVQGKKWRVQVTCTNCWKVDPEKLDRMVGAREKMGYQDLQKARDFARQYIDLKKNINSIRPGRDQRDALRRARTAAGRFPQSDVDYSEFISHPGFTGPFFEAVGWAMDHKHSLSERGALDRVKILIEEGVTVGEFFTGTSIKPYSEDDEDLLDLIPE